jgi:L-lactate utilization protein LutB
MEVASVAETKPRPKLNKKAVEMAKQEPKVRAKNFSEVALGYTEAEAQEEASRCLCCPNPLCRTGCPVEVPIPTFVKCIKEKKYAEGIAAIKSKTPCRQFADVFAHKKCSAKLNASLARWVIQSVLDA